MRPAPRRPIPLLREPFRESASIPEGGHSMCVRGHSLMLCPICHTVRVFEVRAEPLRWPQWISHWRSSNRRHRLSLSCLCPTCGLLMGDPTKLTSSIQPTGIHHTRDGETLWELLSVRQQERFRAHVEETEADRMAGRGSPSRRRQEALHRPIAACIQELELRLFRSRLIDWALAPTLLALGARALYAVVYEMLYLANPHAVGNALLLVTAMGMIAVVMFQLRRRREQRIVAIVHERLAWGLVPLNPTPIEQQESHRQLGSGVRRRGDF